MYVTSKAVWSPQWHQNFTFEIFYLKSEIFSNKVQKNSSFYNKLKFPKWPFEAFQYSVL